MKLSLVEFADMEFGRRCATIRSFCDKTYPMLKASYEDYEHLRAELRKRDLEVWGNIPNDETYEDGEEIQVAYEHAPISEAIELVGLFSLVYLVCAMEKFFNDVMKSCGWKMDKKRGKSEIELGVEKIEEEVGEPLLHQEDRELMREIICARNDFVHRRGQADRAKKFVRDGEITFTRENVMEVTIQIERICTRLVERCKPFSAPFP